ncbi:MBL fold metallo-hydrolase [Methanocella arvoryzae]|uniref:Metallo-beta-lactamase domain-containing protein n=1 Tax=Methanocella arvoryzae (strain DSM 22066 / NBRC 105507 / MRE50) TaxID=351160 RepID=Q0W376_METAR|nr:MBL fold metallo-hydrolase [Methanocella arvoryzae]CAJ37167.1 conserved hypothetical protein [Methanocella arvoryzae MRE50]
MKPVHVAGETFYIPGITNVCLYKDYILDPSNNENVDWDSPLPVKTALISHCHTDHFWNGAKLHARGVKIYAPREERSMIENTAVNTNGNFCWAVPPESMLPWYFRKICCPVDDTLDRLVSPIKVVPLPGHSQWQCGFLTPDGVFYVADSMVTKKVWDTKHIVYYTSVPDARKSLETIIRSKAEFVLPSHGVLLNRDQAVELAEVNLKGIDMLEEAVIAILGREERTVEEMVSLVGRKLGIRDDFSMHIVCETTVRSMLYMLNRRKEADYELRGHKVYWKARP